MERLQLEREFHDQQARQRAVDLAAGRGLRFTDAEYLDHETWIRPAFRQLGPLDGRRVLDLGCGHGMMAVVLARHGARVTALELSSGYLAEAARRASANEVELDLVQADAERLPFADESFDAVWGNAILHHLEIPRAAQELRRVLRPGGVAVLCEPWGGNPLLEMARSRWHYPAKNRTRDELPLRMTGVRQLREVFPGLRWRGHQLLGMVRRVCTWRSLLTGLDYLDGGLLTAVPILQRFCRYVVLTLPRER